MSSVKSTTVALFALLIVFVAPAEATPRIQHWMTANGARVYFVPAPQVPMVDIEVVFAGGSARDGGKPGLAVLTNSVLAEGAGELDADAIAARFDSVGAEFDNDALRDMATVSLRSLTAPDLLPKAVKTMALVLAHPTFPKDALERERSHILVALKQQAQSPGDTASKAFYRALYGDHPYASPSLGTAESVKALTREEVLGFYRRYYVGRNAVVAIVGNLERPAAERLSEQVVGGLPAGERAALLPAVKPLTQADLVRKAFPSTQTHILMGQPGMKRGDPDYFPLYVGNHILGGGGLVSRLNDQVREKRGLSYSVYSYFVPMAAKGPFILGLQTRNEKADKALGVMKQTLKRFVAEGPTAKELKAAKENITGGFPLRIASNSSIASYLAVIGFYDLPLDYLDTFNRKVSAVTAAQIRDAFRRRVQPQRMVTVMVGGGR